VNYADPKLRRMLAGEYALGTLDGGARRRFEALLRQDPDLRRELVFWETRLAQLGLDLSPVKPPPRVWARLRSRIAKPLPHTPGEKVPWWERINLWRAAFAVSSAVAVALLVVLLLIPAPKRPGAGPPQASPAAANQEYMAVIRDRHHDPLWLVTADMRSRTMSVRVMQGYKVPSGKSLELWIMPGKKNAKPMPMGLIPTGGVHRGAMPHKMAAGLKSAHELAVSLEPAGGSPTGEPTGPVLFTATLMAPQKA